MRPVPRQRGRRRDFTRLPFGTGNPDGDAGIGERHIERSEFARDKSPFIGEQKHRDGWGGVRTLLLCKALILPGRAVNSRFRRC